MKNMKKWVAVLAIIGASIGLEAQAYEKPIKEKQRTGISKTSETPVQQNNLIVPEKVKTAFSEGYSKSEMPTWSKDGENFKASFTNDGLGSVAVYDKNGKLIRSERELRYKYEYPDEISVYLDKNGKKTSRVWEYERNGAVKYYSKDENGRIAWFDKEGKHMLGEEHVAHHKSNTSSTYHRKMNK